MHAQMDARALLESLVGRRIRTVTGVPNTVLRIAGDDVIVATRRSPAGQPVPIVWVQDGLDGLLERGEVETGTDSLHHRGSFVAGILLTLPGAIYDRTSPPRIRLTDPASIYRFNVAGKVNDWWSGDPRQRFWLETTDRPDIGVDLHCPQRDAAGNRSPGFSLIWWVDVGDIVLHYSLNEHAITACSRAVGHVTEAPTEWLSHRGETRRRLQIPRPQPGWWLDLDGPFPLEQSIPLAQLRERAEDIRSVLDGLKSDHAGSLYFPFYFWGGSELRPMQPYLSKWPAKLIDLFPGLVATVESITSREVPTAPDSRIPELGTMYREAHISGSSVEREPFTVDPALVERGLRGHADTQNELAQVLRDAGIEPRSRLPQEPNFDLAWERDGTVFVAEIKSITDNNEEGQLRLGLGQVLRYRHQLEKLGHEHVVAVLIPERAPRDNTWRELCRQVEVVLIGRNEIERAPGLRASLLRRSFDVSLRALS